MLLTRMTTTLNFKISFILLIFFFVIVTVEAKNNFIILDEQYLNVAAKKLKKIQKNALESGDVILLFYSESVPSYVMKNFLMKMAVLQDEFHIKAAVVFQGFISKKMVSRIKKQSQNFEKYQYGENFKSAAQYMFDPFIFKKYHIDKVPVLAFGKYENGDFYPSKCNILYLARGEMDVSKFLKLIAKEDQKYEKYSNFISKFVIDNQH